MKIFCECEEISGTMYDENDKNYLMGYELRKRIGFATEILGFLLLTVMRHK